MNTFPQFLSERPGEWLSMFLYIFRVAHLPQGVDCTIVIEIQFIINNVSISTIRLD